MRNGLLAATIWFGLVGFAPDQVNTVTRLTGCDHITGWSDQVRATAAETWLYAQMSANAYHRKNSKEPPFQPEPPPFKFEDAIREREHHDNDDTGFAYAVFERTRSDGEPSSWVIAFRGTENDRDFFNDWIKGNAGGLQNPRGLAVYRDLRRRHPGASISVTGHSLGGGIASNVSQCADGEVIPTYIFNSSPRFRLCGGVPEPRRWSVVERGEILYLGRALFQEATQKYTSLNCTRQGHAVHQHSIELLATCLTRIAAWEDAGARESLRLNGIPFVLEDPNVIAARRASCPSDVEQQGH